jgi:NADH:ubiquinone reductase (non-electrogenic)
MGAYVFLPSDLMMRSALLIFLQFASGGFLTFYFWRSAYLSTLFSLRNRTLVATDWVRTKIFGRFVPYVPLSGCYLTLVQ